MHQEEGLARWLLGLGANFEMVVVCSNEALEGGIGSHSKISHIGKVHSTLRVDGGYSKSGQSGRVAQS